ncbi:hypothetical protein EDD22DRAFT_955905 [Suillus occidentalis]|nr:hypothetical protein EDD22DRAFT_955905 [Suillus occidentalis]
MTKKKQTALKSTGGPAKRGQLPTFKVTAGPAGCRQRLLLSLSHCPTFWSEAEGLLAVALRLINNCLSVCSTSDFEGTTFWSGAENLLAVALRLIEQSFELLFDIRV